MSVGSVAGAKAGRSPVDAATIAVARVAVASGEGRRIREAAGISLGEFVTQMPEPVSVATLSRWERGLRVPKGRNVESYAVALARVLRASAVVEGLRARGAFSADPNPRPSGASPETEKYVGSVTGTTTWALIVERDARARAVVDIARVLVARMEHVTLPTPTTSLVFGLGDAVAAFDAAGGER